ncbi:hypothetical protein F935_01205 [Acinetobacter calcoaceticus ANC 3811]|uniref:Endonuclease GajA/Old nuclease/RecF-like AAA domain-containing protein n=2 Tax=Acinetobacter calcoaceticus/baumannii complex TaxID=909768 RepID=R8Y374_ACICA|nr:AAA family ATPase [Acinetobacter calcoaceticus]EOQ63576.1 hypothetical protein F935_01205 [Acinetobacter calcoaceticus ANC 3811]
MKIVKIDIYNLVKEKYLLDLNINQEAITFLTGYNGTCKTSILQAIHKTICEFSNYNFPIVRKKWGIEIEFEDGNKIINICFPPNKEGMDTHDFFQKHMDDISGENLVKFFDTYQNVQDKVKSENLGIKFKDFKYLKNNEKRTETDECQTLMTIGFVNSSKNTDEKNIINSILLYDEQISLSFKNDLKDDSALERLDVFSQKNNIDKTLFRQIDIYKSKNVNSILNEDIYSNLKNLIRKDSIQKFNDEFNKNLSENNIDNHSFFMNELNNFFNLTKRELKFNRLDSFYYEKNEKIIKWYDFSKGEKFLLLQLLLAYNFRNDNCIFLFDEPDAFLHIEWQQILLSSLKKVSPNSTFIIASHSPSLISKETKIKFVNLNKYIV